MPSTIREQLEIVLEDVAASGPAAATVLSRLYADEARAAADAADARRRFGRSLGPLDGTLMTIKDLFDVAGETTLAGSIIERDAAAATADAPVVGRLRAAGAVIIGKTTMSEYAFSGIGMNPHTGTPGNVADPARVPGGSSSGAGISVGRRWAEVGIGSDTGGSVRIPAALNGLVGFKPSCGRVPTEGAFPLSYTLDTIGPIVRRVEAAVRADAILSGRGLGSRALPPEPIGVAGLRLAVPRGFLFSETDEVVGSAFEEALALLRAAGVMLVEVDLDEVLTLPVRLQQEGTIAAAEAAHIHRATLDSRAADFDARVRARIDRGRSIPAPVYVGMLRDREAAKARATAVLAPFDALVAPTVPIVAPRIADLEDVNAFNRNNMLVLRNPSTFNILDLPAFSLPVEVGQPLPVGLMLVGKRDRDEDLFPIAAALEPLLQPTPRYP